MDAGGASPKSSLGATVIKLVDAIGAAAHISVHEYIASVLRRGEVVPICRRQKTRTSVESGGRHRVVVRDSRDQRGPSHYAIAVDDGEKVFDNVVRPRAFRISIRLDGIQSDGGLVLKVHAVPGSGTQGVQSLYSNKYEWLCTLAASTGTHKIADRSCCQVS